ncbi:MAG: hypothetical protein L3V56_14640 [Candidatus Magnetoovum sp. WYHC-5]|nr:hypothetical protein [Candidatus Magnetoovum sp. WYHC-5]
MQKKIQLRQQYVTIKPSVIIEKKGGVDLSSDKIVKKHSITTSDSNAELNKPAQPCDHRELLKSGLGDLYKVTEYFKNAENNLSHKRMKCWEYRNCKHTNCPVRTQAAGRRCWLVAGTLSGKRAQCQLLTSGNIDNCKNCDFYKKIKKGTV